MKPALLLSAILVVSAGCGAIDPGAAITTAGEAKARCREVQDVVTNFTPTTPQQFDAILDSIFQMMRAGRDDGALEVDLLAIGWDSCQIDGYTTNQTLDCNTCFSAIIASIYDE